jgi:hypothetical protein
LPGYTFCKKGCVLREEKNKKTFNLVVYKILPFLCLAGYVISTLFIKFLGFAIGFKDMLFVAIGFIPFYLLCWFQAKRLLEKGED